MVDVGWSRASVRRRGSAAVTEPWIDEAQSSAHRLLHERADPCLHRGIQVNQGEGDRPHASVVEIRLVAEADRRVPRLELPRALEVADDLAVLGIRGHPVPEPRREAWGAGFDDRVEPLAKGAIRWRHGGDLREHGAFSVRPVRPQLSDAVSHRGFFLVRESLGHLARHAGDPRGHPRALPCRFLLSHAEAPPCAERVSAAYPPLMISAEPSSTPISPESSEVAVAPPP